MVVKYLGKTICGIQKGHEYVVKFEEPKNHVYVYGCHFIYDITKEENVDLYMQYASRKSIDRNFKYDKFEIGE